MCKHSHRWKTKQDFTTCLKRDGEQNQARPVRQQYSWWWKPRPTQETRVYVPVQRRCPNANLVFLVRKPWQWAFAFAHRRQKPCWSLWSRVIEFNTLVAILTMSRLCAALMLAYWLIMLQHALQMRTRHADLIWCFSAFKKGGGSDRRNDCDWGQALTSSTWNSSQMQRCIHPN